MWFSDFLLAQWLWGMTWGFYHIPLTLIIMALLIRKLLKWSIVQALVLSLIVNFASVATYTLAVIGIINFMQGPAHELKPQEFGVVSTLQASLILGLTYTILDSIFFYLFSFYFKFSMFRMAFIALLSNGAGALIVYAMQPLLG